MSDSGFEVLAEFFQPGLQFGPSGLSERYFQVRSGVVCGILQDLRQRVDLLLALQRALALIARHPQPAPAEPHTLRRDHGLSITEVRNRG